MAFRRSPVRSRSGPPVRRRRRAVPRGAARRASRGLGWPWGRGRAGGGAAARVAGLEYGATGVSLAFTNGDLIGCISSRPRHRGGRAHVSIFGGCVLVQGPRWGAPVAGIAGRRCRRIGTSCAPEEARTGGDVGHIVPRARGYAAKGARHAAMTGFSLLRPADNSRSMRFRPASTSLEHTELASALLFTTTRGKTWPARSLG